jgi:tetratricopeptide (TPR) repeat protein
MNVRSQHALSLAEGALARSRPEKALEALARVDAETLEQTRYWILRASALGELGRYPEAAEAAQSGLTRGCDPWLLYYLARALTATGDLPGAERAVLAALAAEPENPSFLVCYAWILGRGRQLDKARRVVERAERVSPENEEVIAVRALVEYARAKDRRASAAARSLLAINPSNSTGHYMLATLGSTQGSIEDSYRHVSAAIAEAPPDADYLRSVRRLRFWRNVWRGPSRTRWLSPDVVWVGLAVLLVLAALGRQRFIAGAMLGLLAVLLVCRIAAACAIEIRLRRGPYVG